MQIVGYDATGSVPYWIVRNQWGTGWGEVGYVRLAMGTNTCQLTYLATFVTPATAGRTPTNAPVVSPTAKPTAKPTVKPKGKQKKRPTTLV